MKVPCKYSPGDKIFAKVKGFVYWPARVNPLPEDIVIPANKIPIFFYGTHEVFFISPTSCWPYDEKNKSKWGKQRSRAYFNQGIDEIENYSTIYQYGVDPLAEEFLSQFYQFRKSNGQNSTPNKPNKVQPSNENEDVDSTKTEGSKKKQNSEKESNKQIPAKKRNKSGSSLGLKENKSDSKSVLEKEDIEAEARVEDEQTNQTRKRHMSESELSAKENNLESNLSNNGVETTKDQGVSLRKRQKSGISELNTVSTTQKATKSNDKRRLKRISTKGELRNENAANGNESKDFNDEIKLKLDISEIIKAEIVLEESNKSEKMAIENASVMEQPVKTELVEEQDCGPTTRRRTKSSSAKPSNNSQSVATAKNSDMDSKSPSVDSDNLADEDFRPAVKPRSPKKTKISRSNTRASVKKAPAKPPKRTSSTVKAATKRKSNVKIETTDSLSSISSDEHEPVVETLEKEPVKKVIDISQIYRDPSDKEKVKPNLIPVANETEAHVPIATSDEVIREPAVQVIRSQDDEICKVEKEVVVNIYKTDMVDNDVDESVSAAESNVPESAPGPWVSISSPREDLKLTFTNKNRCRKTKAVSESDKEDRVQMPGIVAMEAVEESSEPEQKSDIAIINESLGGIEREAVVIPTITEEDKSIDMQLEIKIDETVETDDPLKVDSARSSGKKSSINIVIESDEDDDKPSKLLSPAKSIDNISTERTKKAKSISSPTKETKPSKSSGRKQKQVTSRKRNRKLSSSSGYDIEITKHEHLPNKQQSVKRARLAERSSGSDDNSKPDIKTPAKNSVDRVQLLHNYNADIRSSLILGHEDYKTCLARFRSLCEMPIDLVSLIKVWQLMDTVKKCRRYKRNEEVKQEAQAVYKRFMGIYSRASKDEINSSQAILMQYRHQNNIQNQNVGGDAHKSNGAAAGAVANTPSGSQQGPQMPISVADMFQNNRASNTSESSQAAKMRATEGALKSSTVAEKAIVQATEDEINEEKMRLLSADLEAKVSDILNKIEKNVDMNPINQRSLSHLLPAASDETPSIQLPLQWQCVNRTRRERDRDRSQHHHVISDDDLVDIGDIGDIGDDDDDEDDVETIVRRIEEVAIRLNGSGGISGSVTTAGGIGTSSDHDDRHGNGSGGMGASSEMVMTTSGGSSSALDARIENLINNSFIASSSAPPINSSSGSTKEPRQSKRSARVSSQHAQSHRSSGKSHHHHSHSQAHSHNHTNNDSSNNNSNSSSTSNHGNSNTTISAMVNLTNSTSPSTKPIQILSNPTNSAVTAATHKSEIAVSRSPAAPESRKLSPPLVPTQSPSPSQHLSASVDSSIEQKDDIEIYDLLGV